VQVLPELVGDGAGQLDGCRCFCGFWAQRGAPFCSVWPPYLGGPTSVFGATAMAVDPGCFDCLTIAPTRPYAVEVPDRQVSLD
jgi:hypothetical protein